MTQEKFKHLEKDFESMTDLEQWQWLINFTDKSDLIMQLDNDTNYVTFKNYREGYLVFNEYIGNSYGVELLLEALGISNEGV